MKMTSFAGIGIIVKIVLSKGVNFMTGLYYSNNVSLPVTFQLISKTETVIDKKTGKPKRKSKMTKK
jgi:hypothetical protein